MVQAFRVWNFQWDPMHIYLKITLERCARINVQLVVNMCVWIPATLTKVNSRTRPNVVWTMHAASSGFRLATVSNGSVAMNSATMGNRKCRKSLATENKNNNEAVIQRKCARCTFQPFWRVSFFISRRVPWKVKCGQEFYFSRLHIMQ